MPSRSLKPGMRPPATRDFAGQHGISRRVVVNVFEQLRTEAYLVSRHRFTGTCVSDQLPEDLLQLDCVADRPSAFQSLCFPSDV
jgi:DNA-binding transcriptional regulator YhcF (GntR family)